MSTNRLSKQPSYLRAYGTGENASDLYAYASYNIFRNYRIYDPNLDASSDHDAYRTVLLDSTASRGIETFLRSVCSVDYRVIPFDTKANDQDQLFADICYDAFSYTDNFTEARKNLASGLIRGRSYAQIIPQTKWIRLGGKWAKWTIPHIIQDEDPRRFQYFIKRLKSGHLLTELRRFNRQNAQWQPLTEFEDRLFLKLINNNLEDKFGYGESMIEKLYELMWLKTNLIKLGMQGIELWAKGLIIAKPAAKESNEPNATNSTLESQFQQSYNQMRAGRGFWMIDKEDEVEVHLNQNGNNEMVMKWIEYINNEIIKLITGSLLPSGDANSVGSKARAVVEEDQALMYLQHPRELIDQTLTRDLIGWFQRANFRTLYDLGLTQSRVKFITGKERSIDPLERLAVGQRLQEMGYQLDVQEVFEHTGYTPPTVTNTPVEEQLNIINPGGIRIGQQTISKPKDNQEEIIPGGKAAGIDYSQFDQAELMEGIHVEMEHSNNIQTAMEIAADHLTEDPQYYQKLKTIHQDDTTQFKNEQPRFWQTGELVIDDQTRTYLQRDLNLKFDWKKVENPLNFEQFSDLEEITLTLEDQPLKAIKFEDVIFEDDFVQFAGGTKLKMKKIVGSSAIDLIQFQNRSLWVKFHSGSILYLFRDVPRRIFEKFKNATSKGKFYHRSVKRYSDNFGK